MCTQLQFLIIHLLLLLMEYMREKESENIRILPVQPPCLWWDMEGRSSCSKKWKGEANMSFPRPCWKKKKGKGGGKRAERQQRGFWEAQRGLVRRRVWWQLCPEVVSAAVALYSHLIDSLPLKVHFTPVKWSMQAADVQVCAGGCQAAHKARHSCLSHAGFLQQCCECGLKGSSKNIKFVTTVLKELLNLLKSIWLTAPCPLSLSGLT